MIATTDDYERLVPFFVANDLEFPDEEDYEEYIGRCATNPLAIAVKIHDLTDNMDVRRMPCIGEKEISRLKKYLKAYHRLMPFYMNH